jgi:hypothetical protein
MDPRPAPESNGVSPLAIEKYTVQLTDARQRYRFSYSYNMCLVVSVLFWRFYSVFGAGGDTCLSAVVEKSGHA